MKLMNHRLRSIAVAVGGLALFSLSLAVKGDVPYPNIPQVPQAKAEQCVEPTEVMRRSHMEFILHQRDETMHRGIRTKRHSLKECISCHVNPGPDGQYPRVASDQHFCAACHSYASVTIDCFQCHSDIPEQPDTMSENQTDPHSETSLKVNALMDSAERRLAAEVRSK